MFWKSFARAFAGYVVGTVLGLFAARLIVRAMQKEEWRFIESRVWERPRAERPRDHGLSGVAGRPWWENAESRRYRVGRWEFYRDRRD